MRSLLAEKAKLRFRRVFKYLKIAFTMIKAVIFDFDGVVRRGEYFSKRVEQKYGIPNDTVVEVLKSQDYKDCQLGKKTMQEVWAAPLKKWKLLITLPQLFDFWFNGEYIDKEITSLIDGLRKKVKIILLTNNPRIRLDFYNKQDGLFKHFDEVIISADIGLFKTGQEAAKLVCKLANAKPDEIVVVDNSAKDLEKHAANGFKILAYTGIKQLRADLNEKFKL